MRCKYCGKILNKDEKYCSNCGKEVVNRMSKITKISLGMLILLVAVVLIVVAICIYQIFASNDEAYGWLLGLAPLIAFLPFMYYVAVFVASLLCDKLGERPKHPVRDVIVTIALILPILFLIIFLLTLKYS
jgi:predicted nucleic acid-binding Zn ribbon protein